MKSTIWAQGAIIQETQKQHVKSNKEIKAYFQSIQDTPTYACYTCDRFSFGKDMQSIDKYVLSTIFYLMHASNFKYITLNEKIWKSCNNAICNEKVPTFASPLYIRRNEKLIFIA